MGFPSGVCVLIHPGGNWRTIGLCQEVVPLEELKYMVRPDGSFISNHPAGNGGADTGFAGFIVEIGCLISTDAVGTMAAATGCCAAILRLFDGLVGTTINARE